MFKEIIVNKILDWGFYNYIKLADLSERFDYHCLFNAPDWVCVYCNPFIYLIYFFSTMEQFIVDNNYDLIE